MYRDDDDQHNYTIHTLYSKCKKKVNYVKWKYCGWMKKKKYKLNSGDIFYWMQGWNKVMQMEFYVYTQVSSKRNVGYHFIAHYL